MEHDRHCDLQAPGPYEPDCGCRSRAQEAEIERLRALVRHMDKCVQRGGPSNYAEFLPDDLAGALGRATTEE